MGRPDLTCEFPIPQGQTVRRRTRDAVRAPGCGSDFRVATGGGICQIRRMRCLLAGLVAVAVGSGMTARGEMTAEEAGRFMDLALAGIDREFPEQARPGDEVRGGREDAARVVSGVLRALRLAFVGARALDAGAPAEVVPGPREGGRGPGRAGGTDDGGGTGGRGRESGQEPDLRADVRLGLGPAAGTGAAHLGRRRRAGSGRGGSGRSRRSIVSHAKQYLAKLDWPIRCGFHPESAFPLAQMLDYARGTGEAALEQSGGDQGAAGSTRTTPTTRSATSRPGTTSSPRD